MKEQSPYSCGHVDHDVHDLHGALNCSFSLIVQYTNDFKEKKNTSINTGSYIYRDCLECFRAFRNTHEPSKLKPAMKWKLSIFISPRSKRLSTKEQVPALKSVCLEE